VRVLDAPTQYKFWLLEAFGWQVVHVPFAEWAALAAPAGAGAGAGAGAAGAGAVVRGSVDLARAEYLAGRLARTPLAAAVRGAAI
jgi:hypothetical protein